MARNQIDGDQVQDETLTSDDILNSSILDEDLQDYSFQTLRDVDITGVVAGDKFEWNGSDIVPYKDLKVFAEDTTGMINNTQNLFDYITLNFTAPVAGLYEVDWTYMWSLDNGSRDFISQVVLDNGLISYRQHQQEPKDVAGGGEVLPTTTGGTGNTGTDQQHSFSSGRVLNLTAGGHTVILQFAGGGDNYAAAMYGGNIKVKRF